MQPHYSKLKREHHSATRATTRASLAIPKYYEKLRDRSYSRMGFQYDGRWSVSIRKASINLEKRLKERRHDLIKNYETYVESQKNNTTPSEVKKFLGLE